MKARHTARPWVGLPLFIQEIHLDSLDVDIRHQASTVPFMLVEDGEAGGCKILRVCSFVRVGSRFQGLLGDEDAAAAYVLSRSIVRRQLVFSCSRC